MSIPFETGPLPTGFSVDPNKTAGNTHSGHNVLFGVLDGFDVAVKPFQGQDGRTLESRRNKAEQEMRMYKMVGKLGYLTLKPISVIDEHGIAYLITEYTPNLVAGTSFDMTAPVEDSSRGKSPAEVTSSIMRVVGNLHDDSITHGDAKLRNFAFHRATGAGPYVVDLEGAQAHKSQHERGREFYLNALRNDLRSISYNLGQNGLGAQAQESELADIFSDLIVTPYQSAIGEPQRIPATSIETAWQAYQNGVRQYIEVDHKY